MIQLYIYMHLFFYKFSFHLGNYRILSRVPCAIRRYLLAISLIYLLLFNNPVISDSLPPHGLKNTRPPCPSSSTKVWPSCCPLIWQCHKTVSSSGTLFSFCSQSFPALGTFPGNHLFTSLQSVTSVAQSCPTLCDPMNCSTPGLPIHHKFLEFNQTHAQRVSDAIQSSHPLSSPSPPTFNLSQHQGLFQ